MTKNSLCRSVCLGILIGTSAFAFRVELTWGTALWVITIFAADWAVHMIWSEP